jgi:NAD(P)-dependent dehydrogenase (short-subunit alcohol dehydrogenase family)
MDNFENKVAVITGAASGMGLAFARRFGQEGMKVVLTDVEEDALNAATQALKQEELDVIGVQANVANLDEVQSLADKAMKEFGRVDILCNNAGVAGDLDFVGQRNQPLWEQSPELWNWTFGVNVTGVLNGIRTFLPIMLSQNEPGHVVNTASMAGLLGGSSAGIYGATKHAVVRITEALYFQLMEAESKIHASVLCPGIINTRIFSSGRNRPDIFWTTDEKPDESDTGARIDAGDQFFAHGLPPESVADQLLESIKNNQFWVLTPDVPLERISIRHQHIIDQTNPSQLPPLTPIN